LQVIVEQQQSQINYLSSQLGYTDCNGIIGGSAVIQTYYWDTDGDGIGCDGSDIANCINDGANGICVYDFCNATVPAGWYPIEQSNSDCDDCQNGIYDECGVCGGDGIPDGECDCEGNVLNDCGCGEDNSSCVTDIDGNLYTFVQIGNQAWMAENLNTTQYQNGDFIGYEGNWTTTTEGRYADDYTSNYSEIYGKLYNLYAVMDGRGLCMDGWHVPTREDWEELADFLGGTEIAGGKLKGEGTDYWAPPNEGATDEFGFTALPGGMISGYNGTYFNKGNHFYSSSSSENKISIRLFRSETSVGWGSSGHDYDTWRKMGFGVRCLED